MNFNKTNNAFVLIYKLLGAIVLTLCVLAVLSYAILFTFYSVNRSWVTPFELSSNHEKVVQTKNQIDEISRLDLKLRSEFQIKQSIAQEKTASLSRIDDLISNIKKADQNKSSYLKQAQGLLGSLVGDRKEFARTNAVIAQDVQKNLSNIDAELAAGLITKEDATRRKISMYQIKQQLMNDRSQTVQVENQNLVLQSQMAGVSGLSLQSIQQVMSLELKKQELALEASQAQADALAAQKALEQTGSQLASLNNSIYAKAVTSDLHLGFVPYDNMSKVVIGAPVFDCYLHMFACHEVGTVSEIYSTENYSKHPLYHTEAKGQNIEINYTAATVSSSKQKVLFIGKKPMFF